MSINQGGRVHLKIKLTGNNQKIRFFHYLMGSLDIDWPFAPLSMRRDPSENLYCKECGGMIYRTPMFTAEQIRITAKQVDDNLRLDGHLKVKVKKYTANPQCGMVEELADPEEEITVPAEQASGSSAESSPSESSLVSEEVATALAEYHTSGGALIGINFEGAAD